MRRSRLAHVINLDDRFNSVSTQSVSTDPDSGAAFANYQALEAAGVAGANSIGGVFWFTNAFDTSSSGVDVVATMPFDFDNSSGKLTASLNYNKTEFESEVTQFFNSESTFDFINNTPNTRWILTYNHYMGDLSLMGRLSYFGESDNQNGNGAGAEFQEWDAVTFLTLRLLIKLQSRSRSWLVVGISLTSILTKTSSAMTAVVVCMTRVPQLIGRALTTMAA